MKMFEIDFVIRWMDGQSLMSLLKLILLNTGTAVTWLITLLAQDETFTIKAQPSADSYTASIKMHLCHDFIFKLLSFVILN